MEYTQVDKSVQLAAVKARIKDLEEQHLNVSLRVDTPAATPTSEVDQERLRLLDSSLEKLRQWEQQLTAT